MSIDQDLLMKAWSLLWKPNTPYYLPTIIKNGYHSGAITISPLDPQQVGDLPGFSLFREPVLGDISIHLSQIVLEGASSIQNKGLSCGDGDTFTIHVGFSHVTASGAYNVSSSGLSSCAIESGKFVLDGNLESTSMESSDAMVQDNSPQYIDAANQYQQKLGDKDNKNGNQLLEVYYKNNDAMNSIIKKNTGGFADAWKTYNGTGKTTKDYAHQTYVASANPDDPTKTVGDQGYQTHSYYMQTRMLQAALLERNHYKGPPPNPYSALVDDIVGFAKHTKPYQTPMTVNSVMGVVKSSPGPTLVNERGDEVPNPPYIQKAIDDATRDFERWMSENQKGHSKTMAHEVGVKSSNGGGFSGTFSDNVTINGLAISGVLNIGENLTVTLKTATVDIGSLDITLSSNRDPLFAKVQQIVGNMSFAKDMIKKKIADQLTGSSTLSYLQNLINDALSKVFG